MRINYGVTNMTEWSALNLSVSSFALGFVTASFLWMVMLV